MSVVLISIFLGGGVSLWWILADSPSPSPGEKGGWACLSQKVCLVSFEKFFFFFFFFYLFRAALIAYTSTQARGWNGAAAAGLHHSHSFSLMHTSWVRYLSHKGTPVVSFGMTSVKWFPLILHYQRPATVLKEAWLKVHRWHAFKVEKENAGK